MCHLCNYSRRQKKLKTGYSVAVLPPSVYRLVSSFFFSLTHGRLHENFRCYSKISQHSLIAFQLQLLGLSFYLFLDFSTSDNSHKNKKKFHHFPTMTSEIFTFLAKKKNTPSSHSHTFVFVRSHLTKKILFIVGAKHFAMFFLLFGFKNNRIAHLNAIGKFLKISFLYTKKKLLYIFIFHFSLPHLICIYTNTMKRVRQGFLRLKSYKKKSKFNVSKHNWHDFLVNFCGFHEFLSLHPLFLLFSTNLDCISLLRFV